MRLLVVGVLVDVTSFPLLRYEGPPEHDRLLHLLPQHHAPRAGGGGSGLRLRLFRRGALVYYSRRRDGGMGRFSRRVQLLRSLLRFMLLLKLL